MIKFIPDTIFPKIGKKEVDPVKSESMVLSIKGNRGENGLTRKFSSINHPHAGGSQKHAGSIKQAWKW